MNVNWSHKKWFHTKKETKEAEIMTDADNADDLEFLAITLSQIEYPYLPTHPLEQNMTQGQFLSGV